MKKVYIFCFFFAAITSSLAQEEAISSAFLKEQPWQEEVELALERPDSVYKLDAEGLGWRTFPEGFWSLSQLRWLRLGANDFSTLPDDLNRLPYLSHLDISNNEFMEIPELLAELEALSYLDVSGNENLQLEVSIGALAEGDRLQGLRLRELSLQEFPEALSEISSLRYLDISLANELRFLPAEWSQLLALEELEMSYMHLDWDSSFTVLATLPKLQALVVEHNSWEEVPSGLYKLKHLKSLSLEYNALKTLPAELKELPHLEHIYLKGNPFSEEERKRLKENWDATIQLHFEKREDSFWR